jgi:hypothetical protein
MSYSRTYTLDTSPTGDTVKAAVADKIDKDLDSIYTNLNTHEALTATHGATGAVVGTTNVQTLTNKTISGTTLTGTITGTGATLTGCTVSGTVTGGTFAGTTLSGVTTAAGIVNSGTITGGTLAGTTLSGTTTCADLRLANGIFTGTITASDATLVGFSAAVDWNNVTMTGTTTIATANIAAGTFTGTLTASTLGSTTTTNAGTIQGGTISGATITGCTLSSTNTQTIGALNNQELNGTCTGTAFTKNANTNGYAKLGGGLVLQWGKAAVNASKSVSFPLTFPNACLNVTATVNLGTAGITICFVGSFSQTAVNLYCGNSDGTFTAPSDIYWQAIGY